MALQEQATSSEIILEVFEICPNGARSGWYENGYYCCSDQVRSYRCSRNVTGTSARAIHALLAELDRRPMFEDDVRKLSLYNQCSRCCSKELGNEWLRRARAHGLLGENMAEELAKYKQKDAENTELLNDTYGVLKSCKDLMTKFQHSEAENRRLVELLQDVKTERSDARANAKSLYQENFKMRWEIEEAKERERKLTSQIKQLRSKLGETEILKEEQEAIKRQKVSLDASVIKLESELRHVRGDLKRERSQRKEVEELRKKEMEELVRLGDDANLLYAQVMALNAEKEEVQTTNKTLESANAKLKDSNECFEAQIHKLCKQHMIDKNILEIKLRRTSTVGCSVGLFICALWAWTC